MNAIYLDYNATTPLASAAWEAMQSHLLNRPGNPASSHRFGRQARQALEDARERIAALLDAEPDEILFTSGATEANNLAIFGLAGAAAGAIVASPIEHPSVLEPIRQLTEKGYTLTELPVTSTGSVASGWEGEAPAEPKPGVNVMFPADTGSAGASPSQPTPALKHLADARLAALMLANHETGAIQPIEALVPAFAHVPFHCDAAAAAGKMPISFRKLGVTSLTISAHKFHGPKGIGALIVRRNAKLRPLLFGGHQQHGKRPGTEPVALVVGMAAALQWSLQNLDAHRARLLELRRRLLEPLHRDAAPVLLNGPEEGGLPHALNLSFPGCGADALLMSLDLAGVACSTGSACSSGSLLPSPVLAAMGKTGDVLKSAMRFSLSPLLSEAEVDEAARRIVQCVQRLRRTGPDDA
jgi:cysteine desulfurase